MIQDYDLGSAKRPRFFLRINKSIDIYYASRYNCIASDDISNNDTFERSGVQ